MPSSSKNKDLRLAVGVAALVAACGLLPLAWHYSHRTQGPDTRVAGGPAATAPEAETEPPPPGAEVVPPEESESDRGPASASPAGPTLSFGRAAGLHLQPDPLHLNASAAIAVDVASGQVLAQKNPDVVLPMASLTKLMTTLLVLEARQPMDEVLTITEEDVDNERHSRSRLRVGTQLTREEALRLALMSSENRAAHALGRAYPGGLPKLLEAMNARARALGMASTTYADPTGLSNRNQSSARDLAVLVAEVAKNPLIREFSTTPTHLAELGGRKLQYLNSNRLVRNRHSGWDIELQKTGYIVEAGRCLTMLTKVGGHDVVMVLLDSDSNGTRQADAQRLRKVVVAQTGWQDAPVLAKADSDDAPRERAASTKKRSDKATKVAAAKKAKSAKKTAVAKKDRDDEKKTAVAKKERDEKKTTVARKDSDEKTAATKKDKDTKTAAAKKDGDEKTAASKKDARKKTAVARKDGAKKAGRVSKTFAATGGDSKG
ncbi:MAG TPA: serine hydrolase [Ramlibacter sp.]|uniref:D-alanyl-D-alanine carboxypeptidase family protein n=1 Tax=Ramlibacter sp. TaxID=1917967 RepID=UPI002D80BBA5|nr:serine hydrolase [Ramlibacter sp.]HET8748234.1 serine hydrolase [Ramlibacter sp.]